MEHYLKYFMPDQTLVNNEDLYQVKFGRLFVVFLNITVLPLALFTAMNYATGKVLAGHIDAIALASFLSVMYFFKRTGKYKLSVIGFVVTCEFVISAQHLVAPSELGTNLLWAPLIIIVSSYLLGTRLGFRLSVFGMVLMIAAEALPTFMSIDGEHFKSGEILQYNISIIFITALSAFMVTTRILKEEDIHVDHLEHQKRRLFEQKEANSALLNIVGHDIANPLTALQLRIEMMEKKMGENKETEAMKKQIEKIKASIESVRNFRAVESGKLEVPLRPVNLSEAIIDSLETLESRWQEKGIKFKTNFPEGMSFWIKGDPVSLQMSVLNNLMTNAIKFSPENSEVDMEVILDGDTTYFTIRDRGKGIPETLIPYIFSPNRPTTRRGTKGEKGTGLGMPIMKMFLDKFDAKITVSNHKDGGAIFKIEFQTDCPIEEKLAS